MAGIISGAKKKVKESTIEYKGMTLTPHYSTTGEMTHLDVFQKSSGKASTARGTAAVEQYSQARKSIAFENAKKQAIQLKKDAAMKKAIESANNNKNVIENSKSTD